MRQDQNLDRNLFGRPLLYKAMLGAGMALILILAFITGAETKAEWPEYWRIRPVIITPLFGAFGGMFYHFTSQLLPQMRIPKPIAYTLGLIGFVIALWLGFVLGLDGTLWD